MAGTRLCGAPKPSLPTTSKPTTLTPQARRTFQESFDSFERTVQRHSRTDDREFSSTTLRDVRDAAKEVERQLAARQCMRNMKRLEPFLNGLEAYSKVIEVLCNGTPFLSWIWAPIKLMMQLATDHISAFEKLLAAYSQIAAMLPRFDRLGIALQDKPDFQQALAVVYSDILTFHEHAYKLFRRNGWMCFFKSSWGQFGSRFNCILDSLAKHATLIDQEANAYLVSETMQWRREALQDVAKTEKDRSTAQLTAALAWLGLETVPHCGQAYQDNLLHRLINDCCDGTTDWILRNQRMRQWLQNGRGGPILWLKGKPGSGKSTLCAKIVQFLRAPRQSTVLFCFYSYIVSSTYPDPVVFILATLVSQILRQRSDLATYVYEEFVAEGRALSIRSLQEILSNLVPQLAMPRILIDGIDECIRYDVHGKPCDLTPVKDVLVSILQLENPTQACAPTKILIVSRDILELVGKLSKRPTVALDQESDALTADITRYATKCLETIRDRFANLAGIDNVLDDVKRNVVVKSQGMFLWVRLVLAQLEFDAYNLDDLENAVANMPHSLHDFYSRIVHRIMLYPIQSRERTINILKWMMCSKRPLRVTELQDAIVFASGAVSLSERSKLPPDIVDLCKPLIQTDDNGQISFVHFTVQEYLTKSNFISLRGAESCTTITCLNYLTFSLNLSNSNVPARQKAVDVGRCLYSLQPYVHEHWLDHLLAFAAEVPQSKDRQLEAFLASFFFIYSDQYTRYLDPTNNLQVDILAAQTLEPRLQYLERYEHHYKYLCVYVVYRHAKQLHFENPADYREPLDPTPLSVVQHEYATQIDYLLSAVTVPGLTQEQLSTFKTANRLYAFVCRFPGCTGMLAGFPTDDLRTQHETTHKPALFCTHSGCKYSLPFTSQQNMRKHIRDFHESRPKVVSKSIRRRKATLLRGQSDHAPTPSPLGSLDAHSQAQSRTESPPKTLQQSQATSRRHHFIQHYRVQQQQGKIPEGWQQGIGPEERVEMAFQLFTHYRLLNPETAEVESMRTALHFETTNFMTSETLSLYLMKMKSASSSLGGTQKQVQQQVSAQYQAVPASRRKGYICVDSSPDKKFLANCKHCRNKKVYGAYYNAAAHLRRAHFHPRNRGRTGKDEKRSGIGGGDHPPMEYLKLHWIKEVEVEEKPTPQSPESESNDDVAYSQQQPQQRMQQPNKPKVNKRSYRCAVENCRNNKTTWTRLDNFKSHVIRMHKDEDVFDVMQRSISYSKNADTPIEEFFSASPTITMPLENLDASDSYPPVDLTVNKDPGAPCPALLPNLDLNIVSNEHSTSSPTSRVSREEDESSTIRCICGCTDDDGNTVLCEKCDTWQHIACYYYSGQQHVPDIHECVDCLPRTIDSEKANEKQRILREQSTRGLKTSGLKRHDQSHSPKIGLPDASQPEQPTVQLLDFEQYYRNDGKAIPQHVPSEDRAQASYEFFLAYSQKWPHDQNKARNAALKTEMIVFKNSATMNRSPGMHYYNTFTNQGFSKSDRKLPGLMAGFAVPPLLTPGLSQRILLNVYELKYGDWVDRGTGICQGALATPEHARIMVATGGDYSKLVLDTSISKDNGYQRQQDTLIVWTEQNGSDMALSFEKPEGCAKIWDYVNEVLSRLEDGITFY
ncbi:hypothetical protein AG0111_0g2533 [Alternaria gaisen]|uniref:Uncharacterized protein n=1 Tax=Alternaria gaisen TaxID=167740 RepID=A0ACB6FX47_9PLEO|nr:hypothetical protein AG0111_0g2533 [Alternaria gaisen]